MTNLIIHTKISIRRSYLLDMVNSFLNTEYSQISQLHSNPDIHIIEQPEHVSIKIEEVKMLQKEMQYMPFNSKYQLGIIFHAGNMTKEAQNAILKTLEEQSENTIYILLVNNEKSLLPTIISRSVKHYVKSSEYQTETDKELSEGSENSIPELLQMDLISQFKMIENRVEMEKEVKGSVKEMLNELSAYYRVLLIESIRTNRTETNSIRAILEQIEIAKVRASANVNKRLLMENLVMFINSQNGIM